jgi:hypothetical protein
MTRLWPKLGLAFAAGFALADDLPLPQPNMLPVREESAGLEKPSAIIKGPEAGPIVVPEKKPVVADAREAAILETERRVIEEEVQKQILFAYAIGNSSALKQLILLAGPVDAAISRAAKPPTAPNGALALIGLEEGAVVGKSLEQFFGAPMTPDREKALLENVKTQLAGKNKAQMDVRIAGWWPDEGVMAVSVVPRGS